MDQTVDFGQDFQSISKHFRNSMSC